MRKLNNNMEIEKHQCVICKINFWGFGNNAQPVKEGICCDICNIKVVFPARINNINPKDKKNE